MNRNILYVNEKVVFDEAITYAEKHTHQPYASTSYNNNDEIRIPIQQQDLYSLPWYSDLYIEGKVVATQGEAPARLDGVRFINNGILFLFDEIRYEIGGNVIDRIKNPGMATVLKGLATYNKNQSIALKNTGWFPLEESTIMDTATGTFNVIIPLRMFLGFCDDFRKIVLNLQQELVLLRSNTDINALLHDGSKSVKVEIYKVFWRMPHISVSTAERIQLLDILKKDRELSIPFRSREFYEYPLLPQTQRHMWPIKTSMERPQFIFFGLQTDRKNQYSKDSSQFDHCSLTNIKVFLNDVMYPYDNLNLNFNKNQFAALYEMYIEFQESYLEKAREPLLTPAEFKSIAPIVIIDCSKQNEQVKRSPVDIRIEFETSENIPDKTTAYCLIIHDRVVKYVPSRNMSRVAM